MRQEVPFTWKCPVGSSSQQHCETHLSKGSWIQLLVHLQQGILLPKGNALTIAGQSLCLMRALRRYRFFKGLTLQMCQACSVRAAPVRHCHLHPLRLRHQACCRHRRLPSVHTCCLQNPPAASDLSGASPAQHHLSQSALVTTYWSTCCVSNTNFAAATAAPHANQFGSLCLQPASGFSEDYQAITGRSTRVHIGRWPFLQASCDWYTGLKLVDTMLLQTGTCILICPSLAGRLPAAEAPSRHQVDEPVRMATRISAIPKRRSIICRSTLERLPARRDPVIAREALRLPNTRGVIEQHRTVEAPYRRSSGG